MDIHKIRVVADAVSKNLDADVVLYNGEIRRHQDKEFIEACNRRNKRTNIILILVTGGGDPDAAYRIARFLQKNYEKFYLYVSGYCKSAGTLVATGAHEIIMSDQGELGPLDVQMVKKDELWESQSGLTVTDTLMTLRNNALHTFEAIFLTLKRKSEGTITLMTATQIATEMTTKLFAPIYGQVDPLHVGEVGRAMSIATEYGRRLLEEGQNIQEDDLESLMSGYPSHSFVIDLEEAKQLFKNVRQPNEDEEKLNTELGEQARWPRWPGWGEDTVVFLSNEGPTHRENDLDNHEGEEDGSEIEAGLDNGSWDNSGATTQATQQDADGSRSNTSADRKDDGKDRAESKQGSKQPGEQDNNGSMTR